MEVLKSCVHLRKGSNSIRITRTQCCSEDSRQQKNGVICHHVGNLFPVLAKWKGV